MNAKFVKAKSGHNFTIGSMCQKQGYGPDADAFRYNYGCDTWLNVGIVTACEEIKGAEDQHLRYMVTAQTSGIARVKVCYNEVIKKGMMVGAVASSGGVIWREQHPGSLQYSVIGFAISDMVVESDIDTFVEVEMGDLMEGQIPPHNTKAQWDRRN